MIGKYSAREDELSYEDWVDYHRSKADTPEVFFALRDLGHIIYHEPGAVHIGIGGPPNPLLCGADIEAGDELYVKGGKVYPESTRWDCGGSSPEEDIKAGLKALRDGKYGGYINPIHPDLHKFIRGDNEPVQTDERSTMQGSGKGSQ